MKSVISSKKRDEWKFSLKMYHSCYSHYFCNMTCPSEPPVHGGSKQVCNLQFPCDMFWPNLIPQELQTIVQKFRLVRPIDSLVLAYLIVLLTFPDVCFI